MKVVLCRRQHAPRLHHTRPVEVEGVSGRKRRHRSLGAMHHGQLGLDHVEPNVVGTWRRRLLRARGASPGSSRPTLDGRKEYKKSIGLALRCACVLENRYDSQGIGRGSCCQSPPFHDAQTILAPPIIRHRALARWGVLACSSAVWWKFCTVFKGRPTPRTVRVLRNSPSLILISSAHFGV